MKKIIFRKPKIMRNDFLMAQYISIADSISEASCKSELTVDQKYDMLKKCGECLNKAAIAGGFLSTKDFITWMTLHKD